MKKILFLFLTLSLIIFAQNNDQMGKGAPVSGSISGLVFDMATKKPLEYCNVVIHKTRDSSVVTGSVTDNSGAFKIDNIPAGRYYLAVSFIGYDTKKVDSVFISPKNPNRNMGKIYIKDHFYKISDVVVTGQKEEVVNNLDKKVINVDKNLASATGSAVDVLQNIPSVSVDVNGAISLRGSTNVTVLINGKPSNMVGVSGTDILSQVPASSIASVEVVTNPSVKYDPDGTSGIINLVLKKEEQGGFNGMVSLNAGTEDKYNSSFHTNYKTSFANYFFNYDNRYARMGGTSLVDRTSSYNGLQSLLYQNADNRFKFGSNSFNVGADFFLDEYNTLSLSAEYRKMTMNMSSSTYNTNETTADVITKEYLRKGLSTRNVDGGEYGLTYKKTYDRANENLTVDLSYEDHSADGGQDLSQINDIPVGYVTPSQKSISNNTTKQFLGQVNFNFPFNENSKIESGLKSTVRSSEFDNDYLYVGNGDWVEDQTQKNYFEFDEQIHAAYSMITGELLGVKYQTGLRFEYARTKGLQKITGDAFNHQYSEWYPSVHLVKELSEGSELLLSLSRRVDRPRGRQLNPFVSLADSQNVTQGNPELMPQFTNSYELGYSTNFGKTTWTSTAFYRHSTGIITSISYLIDNNITKTTYANIDKSNSYGLEMTLVQPLAVWWRINANASYFNTEFISSALSQNINKSNYSWLAKVNSMMQLPYGIQFQIMMNYNAPVIMPQSKVKAIFTSDVAVKKDFMNGNLTMTLRVSDVFHSQKTMTETSGTNFLSNSTDLRSSRVAYLGVSYRLFNFNKSDDKTNKDNGDAMDY
jgi:outer membrane receptor protein involved in Fe transport